MRLALLHPTYWPEVRRGAERLVHDIAAGMAARGHEVTLLTSSPGRRRVDVEEGVRVVRARRLPGGLLERRGWEYHLAHAPDAFMSLLHGRYDVAHAFFGVDGWAAVTARRLGGPPVVFTMTGLPDHRMLHWRRPRTTLYRGAARGATVSTALSEAAARAFSEHLSRDPVVVPGGVFTGAFAIDRPRAARPTLICAVSARDRRKRVHVLLEAFGRLRERRADARLLLAGGDASESFGSIPGVESRSPTNTRGLAEAYASAWASVMPSVDEAFGLVLIESLAAGTPAVAARSGAGPEVLSSSAVGRLFEPDDPGDLARALDEALELSALPETAEACRAHARAYDWEALLPRYEELYERAIRS